MISQNTAFSELARLTADFSPLVQRYREETQLFPNSEEGALLEKELPLLEKNIRAARAALKTISQLGDHEVPSARGWDETVKSACRMLTDLRRIYAISEYAGQMGILGGVTSTIRGLSGSMFYVCLEEEPLQPQELVEIEKITHQLVEAASRQDGASRAMVQDELDDPDDDGVIWVDASADMPECSQVERKDV